MAIVATLTAIATILLVIPILLAIPIRLSTPTLLTIPILLFLLKLRLAPVLLPLTTPFRRPHLGAGTGHLLPQPHGELPLLQVHGDTYGQELRRRPRAAALPETTAATANLLLVKELALRTAKHQTHVVVAGATRQAEGQQKKCPFSGCGDSHLLWRQHRLGMGAMTALLVVGRGSRAQLVATVMELEEIVVEVVRANTRKALLEQTNVSVLPPISSNTQRVKLRL